MIFSDSLDEVLTEAASALTSGAAALDGVYNGYTQRLDIIRQDYQIQTLLLSRERIRMSTAVFDTYYKLSSIYNALREEGHSWQMTVYSMNKNVLTGAFIEYIEEMRPNIRELALARPDKYLWVYDGGQASPGMTENVYLFKGVTSMGSEVYAVEQIRIGLGRLRDCFSAEFPAGTRLLYFFTEENTAVDLFAGRGYAKLEAARFLEGGTEDYYPVTAEVFSNGDRAAAYVPKSYVRARLANSMLLLTLGYAGVLVMFSLFTALMSRLLSQRLYKLILEMNQDIPNLLENEQSFMPEGTDEFAEINRRFRDLVMDIKARCIEMNRMKAENQALELELLQSMINPHFLYNTLDGIKWTYRDERLSKVIDRLTRYYRIALNRGNTVLRVSEEIEMARLYLEIQKFAYESEFEYFIDLEDEIKNCLMLKNTVQPVVENAFLHGIKRRPQDWIKITGRRDGEAVALAVEDNGTGMDSAKTASLLDGTCESIKSGGYGLYNVIRRIRLRDGQGYGLTIESEKGRGTKVTVRLKYTADAGGGGVQNRGSA
jgi:sensor histidine kinase YesM